MLLVLHVRQVGGQPVRAPCIQLSPDATLSHVHAVILSLLVGQPLVYICWMLNALTDGDKQLIIPWQTLHGENANAQIVTL